MKHNKLNINWNADQNSPSLEISKVEEGIILKFDLNASSYEHIDEKDKGLLEFYNVHKYRLGAINKEAYLNGEFRFSNKQLPWGEYYELSKSNWERSFPDDEIVINDSLDKKGLRHFIFFFKDEIFECIADEYSFSYLNSVDEILDEKYPKGYLSHFLAMFMSTFNSPTRDNFNAYIDLYLQMEGTKEFKGVCEELKAIKRNNDIDLFLKLANKYEIENFGKKQLQEMIKVIEKNKVK